MRTGTPVRRIVAGGALLSLLLAACSGLDPEADADADEMVWTLPATQEPLKSIAERWNEAEPDRASVRVEVLPEGADDQRQQLSLELNAEGSAFDILSLDVIWTGEFAQNGWLEPIHDEVSAATEDLIPGAVSSASYQGEVWAVPFISGAGLLYYRSDLVDEAPRTWDELVEVGQRAAEEEDIAAYVAQGARYEGMVVNYLELLYSAGGDLYNEDQTEVVFNDGDAAAQALSFMQDGIDEGYFAPGFNTMMEDDARNEFQSGNAVFMRNWPFAYPLMQDEAESEVAGSFEIAPLPTFDGEGSTSAVGGVNNAVSAFSEHKEDALAFALFAATDADAQLEVAEEHAQVPVLSTVYDQLEDDPVFRVLADVVPFAQPRPPIPDWNGISTTMQQNLYPAYNGEMDHEAALDAVESALEDAIE